MSTMSEHKTHKGGAFGGAGGASNVLSPEELSKLEKLLLENPSLWGFLFELKSGKILDGCYGQYLMSINIYLTSEILGLSDSHAVDPTELVENRCFILYWEEEPDYDDTSTCMGAYLDYVRILYYDPEDNQLWVYIQKFWGGSCDGFGNSDYEQIHNYLDWVKLGNTLSFDVSDITDITKLDIILRYGKGRKSESIRRLSKIPIETIKSFL
jgi:hypothetical protein